METANIIISENGVVKYITSCNQKEVEIKEENGFSIYENKYFSIIEKITNRTLSFEDKEEILDNWFEETINGVLYNVDLVHSISYEEVIQILDV